MESGDSPNEILWKAIDKDDWSLAEHLIRNGSVDVNARNTDRETPLHRACYPGVLAVIEWLVSQGAEINAAADSGATPLHVACWNGLLDVVRFLILKGANVDAKTNDGITPLHWACWDGNLDIVRFLVSNGASLHSRTSNGKKTPLQLARRRKQREVIQFLDKLSKSSRLLAEQAKSSKLPTEQFSKKESVRTEPAADSSIGKEEVATKKPSATATIPSVSKGENGKPQSKKENKELTSTPPPVVAKKKTLSITLVEEPLPMDCLLGRGRDIEAHEGNKLFRNVIEQFLPDYLDAGTRGEKQQLIGSVMVYLHDKAGMRFLRPLPEEGWIVASQQDVRKKVGQQLRYQLRIREREQEPCIDREEHTEL